MSRIKTRDGGDVGVVIDYLAPVVSQAQVSSTGSMIVALATIAAGDFVYATIQGASLSTLNFVSYVNVTAGTGFTVFFGGPNVSATCTYAVFHTNA